MVGPKSPLKPDNDPINVPDPTGEVNVVTPGAMKTDASPPKAVPVVINVVSETVVNVKS